MTELTYDHVDVALPPNIPPKDVKNPDGLDTNPSGIPQRAGLPRRELQILDAWNSGGLYEAHLRNDAPLGSFILHDGPPFSNGNIHIGHAFNKVLKDVIMKFRGMQGYRAPYVPGWDNNGLPIEVLVAKEFRERKIVPTRSEIRRRCREVATEWVGKQSLQFQRLGIRGDFDHPYLTMTPIMAAKELDVFAEMVEAGYVYRGLRPVYWSLADETALADAEIEYEDRTDPSIHVRFALQDDPDGVFGGAEAALCYTVIWTTTPWTIPANVAVAVGPGIDYALVAIADERYLVASERVEATAAAAAWEDWQVLRTLKGGDLRNLVFRHPLADRDSPMVLADYVTTTDGTGVVHTAPGHGKEDFATGQKYGLPTLQVLTGNGFFNQDAGPELAGLKIGAGQLRVLEMLRESGALLAQGEIFHSYPHGWRSHDPLVYRATIQWFVDIDNKGHREKCLKEIDGVRWFPADSIHRIQPMVANRPDWCISRQRSWGVGIPAFYAQPSGEPLLTRESIGYVRDLVLREGPDAWFEREVHEILPAGYAHPVTGETEFVKETDIFDVWFDSGSTCRTVLEQWPDLSYPADLYLEGGDQHRGWFNSSLMVGVATTGHAPYRQVLTNGWVLDEAGRAMSKSLGNVVAPQEVIDKYGADILRLWICSTDYSADVKVGERILEQVATNYRTLRNTLRFALTNLNAVEGGDFDPTQDAVPYEELSELNRWALHRLNEVVRAAELGYDAYEFHKVAQPILAFCTTDLSAFYYDVLKDTLYSYGPNSPERRGAQTVLFEIVSSLTRLLAPILSFTSDEIWPMLNIPDSPFSVQLATLPAYRKEWDNPELDARWSKILSVRDEVNKALEGAKKRLELSVNLVAGAETFETLISYLEWLPSVLLVSEVTLERGDGMSIRVAGSAPASGTRCSRCRIAVQDGSDPAAECARGCVRSWRSVDGATAHKMRS